MATASGYERITDALSDKGYRELASNGPFSLWGHPKDDNKIFVILNLKDGGYQMYSFVTNKTVDEDIALL